MKKLFLFAAAAAMLLGSCAKDPNGNKDVVTPEGGEGNARLSISYVLPNPPSTRAINDASEAESKVASVTVYIFDNSGIAVEAPVNGVVTKVAADFTSAVSGSSTTFTLKDTSLISTTTDAAKIYVGVNVPDTAQTGFSTEASLLQAIGAISALSAQNSFTMFTEGKAVSPVAYDADNTAGTGGTNATITRVTGLNASRVATKFGATSAATGDALKAVWTMGTSATTDDVTITYALKTYNVYHEALKSYLVDQANTYVMAATTDTDRRGPSVKTTGNLTVLAPSADGAGTTSVFFIGENDPTNGAAALVPTVENSTFAMVSTQATVDKSAVWGTNQVEWTGAAINTNQTLFIVKYGAETYIVKRDTEEDDEDTPADERMVEVNKIANGIMARDMAGFDTASASDKAAWLAANITIFSYERGYVHFMVFLNKTGNAATNYIIGRNEFVHMNVTGVKTRDGVFTGYPGQPENPDYPIDPTDPDPNNPDPIDPTDPVDPLPAALTVEFAVQPWIYKAADVELE